MITRTIFAGFGGQGVLLMGYVLAHGAMRKGLNVTYLPAYGAEVRGGTANCTVTLSDDEIDSPVASEPDILVAMNPPSLERFEPTVAQNGLIMVNSSLIEQKPTRADVKVVEIPLVDLAEKAGSLRAANMVMVGALVAETGLITVDDAMGGMEKALAGKEKFFDLNRAGIQTGADFINERRLSKTG
jgi:2-oxoglutarate ferredoxin oxidoreductase subunit gamma